MNNKSVNPADCYLLDDPLSAVDPHVAKHIFSEAVQGYLADKVTILITHQLQYVKNANKILLLKDGEQQSFGDYNSMLSVCNKMDFTKVREFRFSFNNISLFQIYFL